MLNTFRHISSMRNKDLMLAKHYAMLHMMTEDDVISILHWHCVEKLRTQDVEKEVNRFQSVMFYTPNVSFIFKALEEILSACEKHKSRLTYGLQLPTVGGTSSIVLDRWLTDQKGYYLSGYDTLYRLEGMLLSIKESLANVEDSNLVYHYCKKPGVFYRDIYSLIRAL